MAWTAPRTWVAGETVTAAHLNTHVRDNLKAIGDPWTSFTVNTVNLPLTSSSGKYILQGKTVHCRITTTVSGAATGTISFDIPVTANSTGTGAILECSVYAGDTSAGQYVNGFAILQSTTQLRFNTLAATLGGSAQWNATVPFTWANTDTLNFAFTYEAA
jgi:hypothetical protein